MANSIHDFINSAEKLMDRIDKELEKKDDDISEELLNSMLHEIDEAREIVRIIIEEDKQQQQQTTRVVGKKTTTTTSEDL